MKMKSCWITRAIMAGFSMVILTGFVGCSKYGAVDKELDKMNDDYSRAWKAFVHENGIDAIDNNSGTLLLSAIERKNVDLAMAALKDGADPNRYYIKGYSVHAPMTAAAKLGNLKLMKEMIDKGGYLVASGDDGNILWNAVYTAFKSHFSKLDKGDNAALLEYLVGKSTEKAYSNEGKHLYVDDITYFGSPNALFGNRAIEDDAAKSKAMVTLLKKMFDKGYKLNSDDFLYWIHEYVSTADEESSKILLKEITKSVDDNPELLRSRLFEAAIGYIQGVSQVKAQNPDRIIAITPLVARDTDGIYDRYFRALLYWINKALKDGAETKWTNAKLEELREVIVQNGVKIDE